MSTMAPCKNKKRSNFRSEMWTKVNYPFFPLLKKVYEKVIVLLFERAAKLNFQKWNPLDRVKLGVAIFRNEIKHCVSSPI